MDILRPGFDRLPNGTETERKQALEKQAVLISLENLMTFPFIKDAIENDTLSLHGVWNDIGDGSLEAYDPNIDAFSAI